MLGAAALVLALVTLGKSISLEATEVTRLYMGSMLTSHLRT